MQIFEDSMVQIHFGMAGNASTHTLPGPEPKSTTRLRLENEESEVCMLLSAMTVKIHGADEYDAISGKIGADPLRSDAEKTKFVERMRRSKKSIGMLLMDQSVIAGIGNIYRAEILFKAGVHPEEPASSLPEKLLDSVWFHSVDLLQRGFASGSIMTVDKNHNMPAPWNRRYIYNHEKCGVCAVKRGVDQAVQSWDINNRTVYACPNCQPLLDHSELDEERQNALSNASNAVPFHSKCARDADAAIHEPNKMKVQELKDELAKRSLSTLGKKQVLVERLSEALNDDESETQERMQPQEANGKVQRDDPGSMKVQDLKEELKEHGENTTGKKAELVARLNAARGADAIKPGTEGLEMASAKEAYEEKVAAGEGRNVEHVALADDQTLQQQKSGKKRAASSKRKAATDTANNQVPFKRTKEQAAT